MIVIMLILYGNDTVDLAGLPVGSKPARQSVALKPASQSVALKVGVLATASFSNFFTVTLFIADVFL